MNVTVKSIQPPRKQNVFAHCSVEVELEGQRITLSDLRVLRNRSGEMWVGLPSVAIQDGSRNYHYEPCVELSRELKRVVEDAVLSRYEEWVTTREYRPGVSLGEVREQVRRGQTLDQVVGRE